MIPLILSETPDVGPVDAPADADVNISDAGIEFGIVLESLVTMNNPAPTTETLSKEGKAQTAEPELEVGVTQNGNDVEGLVAAPQPIAEQQPGVSNPKDIPLVGEQAIRSAETLKTPSARAQQVEADKPITNRTASSEAPTIVQQKPLTQANVAQTLVEARMPIDPEMPFKVPPELEKQSQILAPTPTPLTSAKNVPNMPLLNQQDTAMDISGEQELDLDLIPKGEPKDSVLRRDLEAPKPIAQTTTAGQPINFSVSAQLTVQQSIGQEVSFDSELNLQVADAERLASKPTNTATAAPATAGVETARQVANQLAVAISAQPGKPTEIHLNPEELGRVRLSMSAVDASITLTVFADRPETTDLMRRHIDTLAQEFRDLGYDDISFAFSEDHSAGDGASDSEAPTSEETARDDLRTENPQQNLQSSGLDLRL